MRNWIRFVSPWSLAAVAVWIVVLTVVANWAVPVFANVGVHRRLGPSPDPE